MNTPKIYFLISLLALVLTGCASLTKREQPKHYNLSLLEDGDSLGQTFVSRYDGLEGISLYLESEPGGKGSLTLHLRAGSQETTDIRSATLNLEEIPSPDFYTFLFPPLQQSTMKDYYFVVNMEGPGSVKVGIAEGDAYLNGALYLSDVPQDAQAAFLLTHEQKLALWGVFKEGLTWLVWLVVGLFLYVVPGWALLSLLWPEWSDLHWAEKFGLGGGVSLAIYPILLLWTHLVGLYLGPIYAWLPPIVGLVVIIWRSRKTLFDLPRTMHSKDRPPILSSLSSIRLSDLALLFTIGLVVGVRLWVIRSLEAPMWGDSYQHTMIAQLIVDHGGLFDSWQPYAEMTTFTYHFGFHSLVAVFHWITNLPVIQSVLWAGQILNVLAVIFLFPLALKLNRNPWAGLIAVLIAGLLVPMPMYYLNWGRYTQLAGQAILPAAIYMAWTILEARDINRRALIPAWLVMGGLALTHYRVLIFAIIFLLAYMILEAKAIGLIHLVAKIFWMGAGAAMIFLPWGIHIAAGKYLYIFNRQMTTPVGQLSSYTQESNAIGNLFTYLPPVIWLLVPLAVGWGLWRRNRGIALISLWWFLLFIATNPAWLNLPGTGVITNFALFIATYIPAGIIIGDALGEVIVMSQSRLEILYDRRPILPVPYTSWLSIALVILCVWGGYWGARRRFYDPNTTGYALVTRPDLKAIEWLKHATPDNAYILVNSFFAYGGSAIVGSDGGWWLPLLAQRQTTLPPLPYVAERSAIPNYRDWINALWRQINDAGINDPGTLEMLRQRKVTHVYIGQRQGSVNSWDNKIDLNELVSNPSFHPIYHQDRVWVFEFIP